MKFALMLFFLLMSVGSFADASGVGTFGASQGQTNAAEVSRICNELKGNIAELKGSLEMLQGKLTDAVNALAKIEDKSSPKAKEIANTIKNLREQIAAIKAKLSFNENRWDRMQCSKNMR